MCVETGLQLNSVGLWLI